MSNKLTKAVLHIAACHDHIKEQNVLIDKQDVMMEKLWRIAEEATRDMKVKTAPRMEQAVAERPKISSSEPESRRNKDEQ